ncbi:hypothetical protein GCM10027299_23980 [Larkinella ripae]
MATLQFVPGYDLHLLRGQSFQVLRGTATVVSFTDLLEIDGMGVSQYRDQDPTNRTIRFTYSFNEADAPKFNLIIPATNPNGIIHLRATEPSIAKFRLRNFNLFAELTTTINNQVVSLKTAIRIHVHNRIDAVWITPNPMTVSRGMTYFPSLRARFDDGVVAELWNIPKLFPGNRHSYNITNPIRIAWGASPSPNLIDPAGGWLETSTTLSSYKISAEVTFNTQTLRTEAEILVTDTLSKNSPCKAELIAAKNNLGSTPVNANPNILFIPDGFEPSDQSEFDQLLDDYVGKLNSSQLLQPFGTLQGSINYWKLFLPSREGGVTHRADLYLEDDTPHSSGYPIPFILDPKTIPIGSWKIPHLLYRVGLPIMAEKRKDTLSANAPVVLEIITKWEATTTLTATEIGYLKTNTGIVQAWQRFANRYLPEAKDTVLGITINDFTRAVDDGNFGLLNFELARVFRIGLDRFFPFLKDNRSGQTIGPTFNSDLDFNFNQGKDMANIVILSRTNRGRPFNSGRAIFCRTENIRTSTTEYKLFVDVQADQKARVVPPAIPTPLPLEIVGTITHEICHSFGLGDEYGEELPQFKGLAVTNGAIVNVPNVNFDRADAKRLDMFGNLQARIDLQATAPVQTTVPMDPVRLKWRYHRIATCRTVTSIKKTSATTLEVTLGVGQPGTFAAGDPVFIRKRKKNPKAYFVYTLSTGPKTLAGTVLDPDPFPALLAGPLQIHAVPGNDRIIIRKQIPNFGLVEREIKIDLVQGTTLQPSQQIYIEAVDRYGPIYTIFRTPATTPNMPDVIEKGLSPQLTVATGTPPANTLILTIPTNATLSAYLETVTSLEEMLIYKPVSLPSGQSSATYPFAELISKKVLDHLIANPVPFNANAQHDEFVHMETYTRIPASLAGTLPSKTQIIGLYSGGDRHHGGAYHPAASCMMRFQVQNKTYTPLCAVCQYTMINLVNPTKLPDFDQEYMAKNIYPQ